MSVCGSDVRGCAGTVGDNLYVVDSSFFCSSSAVNPTLTIIANALRVAEQIDMRLSESSV